MIQFAYPWILVVGGAFCAVILWWRWRRSSSLAYCYPLVSVLPTTSLSTYEYIALYGPRLLYSTALILLTIALARPRVPHERSIINVDGIGIMLVLDVSQSMLCFDDPHNPVSRFVSARDEAINFIRRRPHDLFGLVLFGRVAATRCPLTLDHDMLVKLIHDIHIGVIPDDETALAQAIIMGVQRLKRSTSKNNIIVLLTDGEPSAHDEQILPDAVSLAHKHGIKIYTIGIGSATGGYIRHPLMGLAQVSSCLRPDILKMIAAQTGGLYFEARNQKELSEIYTNINALETTTQQEPRYTQWYEYYVPLVVVALIALVLAWGMSAWLIIL